MSTACVGENEKEPNKRIVSHDPFGSEDEQEN
jgi:hypothetical protein